MQKKIIALAVAGLVSGAAFAQTNVTLYGIVDMAYVYQGSNTNDDVDSYSALDDGGWDSSRFGLMGTEDLGNGLSINFKQEYSTALDRNKGITARNSYVSLSGKNWGEVKLGSFGTVHDDYAGFTESGGMSWGKDANLAFIVSSDVGNGIEYISPNFSGLQFKVGASTNYNNAADDEKDSVNALGVVTEATNDRAFFASAAYSNGPLKVALTYDNVNQQNSDFKKDEWMITAGYDFGVVKVGAGYDRATAEDFVGATDEVTRDAWRVTLGAPIGANGSVALTYVDVSTEYGDRENDASSWGVSYSHFLSKRTALYAAAYMGDFEEGALVGTTSGVEPSIETYESGIKFGIRHTF